MFALWNRRRGAAMVGWRAARGMAALELAVWSAVMVPVGLLASVLYGFVHDQNVVQVAPEALARETSVAAMTWEPDGAHGQFVADLHLLQTAIVALADQGITEIARTTFKLSELSARACFWVFRIEASSGVPTTLESSRCEERGIHSASLSLDRLLRDRLAAGAGLPAGISGVPSNFVDRVVVLGIAVGGIFNGIPLVMEREFLQHGAVWVPRKEIVL